MYVYSMTIVGLFDRIVNLTPSNRALEAIFSV